MNSPLRHDAGGVKIVVSGRTVAVSRARKSGGGVGDGGLMILASEYSICTFGVLS